MTLRNRLTVVIGLTATLITGGLIGYGYGQTDPAFKRIPTAISGADFGVRLDHISPGTAVQGTLLVRIRGEWHELRPATEVGPFTKR
jgi:hypothetical protein